MTTSLTDFGGSCLGPAPRALRVVQRLRLGLASLSLSLLLSLTLLSSGCRPGPLSPWEVRLRWKTGELLSVTQRDEGVLELVVRCPQSEGGRTVRIVVSSTEVRTFERLRPLARPDALNLVGWRRCGDPSTPSAADPQ